MKITWKSFELDLSWAEFVAGLGLWLAQSPIKRFKNEKKGDQMELQVTVPDASGQFAAKLAAFVAANKKAFEDGWQGGSDVPAILASALSDLLPAIAKLGEVKDDMHKDAFGVALAIQIELKKVL
jgi:hypothetical protein